MATVLAVLVLSVPSPAHGDAGPRSGWVWPLKPRPDVVHAFDPPEGPYGAGHRGVDLSATVGARVVAVAPGEVTFTGQVGGRMVVVVDHGALRTTYEPVLGLVRRGEHVAAGQAVGTLALAGSHCLPFACLHLGVRDGAVYLDPLELLPSTAVRLLPVSAISGLLLPGFPPSLPAFPSPLR